MNNNENNEHNLYLLIDGQLDAASKKKLMDKINASPQLKQKLADISKVKELVSLAYAQETSRPVSSHSKPSHSRSSPPYSSLLVAVAASLIMGLGVMMGWMTHQHYSVAIPLLANADPAHAVSRPTIPQQASIQNVRKFIIHVNFLNEAQLDSAMAETTSILNSYASVGIPVQMEMAFNLQAVRIFEPQNIGQAQKVKALASRYENLKLYACSESLDMFMGDFEMPEDMSVFHVDRIVEEMIPERIDQGWIYIKV
jgi:intracellular sulfur oxidation DsrE/DsrF family protein